MHMGQRSLLPYLCCSAKSVNSLCLLGNGLQTLTVSMKACAAYSDGIDASSLCITFDGIEAILYMYKADTVQQH